MKRLLFIIITMVILYSCKETPVRHTDPLHSDSSMAKKSTVKKDFGKPDFASKKDLSCGMPLTAGLEDTAYYKGKIYGFCSPECKADFVAHADSYVK